MFLGFTPLFGLKTLLALTLAWLLRCNKIAAVIAVSLHDVVTPFWPVLLRLEYDIGYWLLNHPHHLPPKLQLHHHMQATELLHWSTFLHIGLPLLLGSLFISIPAAAIAYFLSFGFFKAREQKRQNKAS